MAMLAPVAIGAGILGTAVSAGGALEQGATQASMYNYRAGVAQQNQKIELQNESYAETAGGVKALESGQRTAFTLGTEKANQGASNVDVNSGTPQRVRDSTVAIGQQNEGIIRSNTAREAYGFATKAAQFGSEADVDKSAASNANTAGGIGALSSLLSGASSVSSKWLQYGSTFGTGNNLSNASGADTGLGG